MKLGKIAAAAGPVALSLVACASDVWLGDVPLAETADGAAADGRTSPADALASSADVVPPQDGAPLADADVEDVASTDASDASDASDAGDASADADSGFDLCSTKDCKGQPCVAGICQPIALATGQPGVLYLAMDASDIFWGTTGHAGTTGDRNVVAKTTLTPGGAVVVLNNDGGEMRGLAVDATQVYLLRQSATSATLGRASKVDGSNSANVGVLLSATNAQGLALDGSYLYAVNGTEIRFFQPSDLNAFGAQLTNTLTAGAAVVSDGDNLFVADPGSSAIDVVTKSTQTMKPLAVSGTPVDIALDTDYVYFAANTSVGRVSRTTGVVEPIAGGGLTGAAGVAVDANNVYYTSTTGIWRVPKGSTSRTNLTNGLTKGGRLLVDSTFVYFADFGQGVIGRVPK